MGYAPSLISGIMPRALEKFHATAPRVRLELSDLSPREMSAAASAGLLDLVLTAAGSEAANPEFAWTELRRLAPMLVLSPEHPLAKLKKVPPARLRGVPMLGLNRENFPEYAQRLRAVLKPFGVIPTLVAQNADGLASLFAAIEAENGAAVLSEGVDGMLPRSLTSRPFSPALAPTVVMAGLPAVRPSPHAESFLRPLREEVALAKNRG